MATSARRSPEPGARADGGSGASPPDGQLLIRPTSPETQGAAQELWLQALASSQPQRWSRHSRCGEDSRRLAGRSGNGMLLPRIAAAAE